MDIQKIAEKIALVITILLAIALGIWLLVELPLWLAPFVFAIAFFLGAAFLGPIIAVGAFLAAICIKATVWLVKAISRRRAQS